MELGLPLPFHLGSCQKSWSTPRVLSTDISWKEGGSSSNAKSCDEGRVVPRRNTTMCPALLIRGEVRTTTLKECLIGVWHWPKYRLLGRCWAEGCGRLMVLHSPWALYSCSRTPMAITLTEQGLAQTVIAEAEELIA